eukprot:TRINITY_DN15206_c1_g1_i1.p1 TRINITY_DN15206_c1_g1~~TRINITY_DN15206_c1_g1_i1.p1  ORF type:complete len:206 (-),score=44.92 TRINITY_DN15206_c1_g1_i1:267-884(-)
MATTLTSTLHAAFENNGALKLRADHFLIVLRAFGTTMTADEGALLLDYLGMDSEGCVDVRKFCAWFEGMEQDPRFAQLLQSLGILERSDVSGEEGDGCQSSSVQSNEVLGEEFARPADVNPNDGDNFDVVGEERGREVSFRPQVSADDASNWRLGSKDKYTLPSRRRLTEREILKASFCRSLSRLKARLQLSSVKFRPELSAQTI